MTTVLVVDANLAVRTAVERTLVPRGMGVFGATGRAGLRQAEDEQPDLVICDLAPADFDALALCAELQRSPNLAGTSWLGLATVIDAELRRRAAAAGMGTILQKPFDGGELADAVDRLLGRDGATTPLVFPAALRTPLAELRQVDGFRCALLVSQYGSVQDGIGDLNAAAAVSGKALGNLLQAAATVAMRGGLGSHSGTIVEGADGLLLIRRVDDGTALVALVSAETPLGRVRLHLERVVRTLREASAAAAVR